MRQMMRPSKFVRRAITGVIVLRLLGDVVSAQTVAAAAVTSGNSASIGGTVRDEAGSPVEARVRIATKGIEQELLTAPDGTFQFPTLKSGIYIICARATGRDAKPLDDPFVDSCLWHDRSSLRVTLLNGQNLRNVTVPVKRGHLLKVRVNDPGKQLPAPVGNTGDNHLAIALTGPSGLAQHVPIIGQDSGGRDHAIVIPYDTLHKLVIYSSTFVLKDGNGRGIDPSAPLQVTVARGSPPPSFVVLVGRPKP